MQLVERHIISKKSSFFTECDNVCLKSKNLYNYANYIIRQVFFITSELKENGVVDHATYPNYYDINKLLIAGKQPDYISLPRKVSNQTLMKLDENWKSFFKAVKDWKKNPSKYKGMPKPPKYLDKNTGRFVAIYELGAISTPELRKNCIVKLSGTNIKIRTKVPFLDVVQCRIVPKGDHYVIEVVYNKVEKELKEDNGRYAAIDLGLNNLACVVSNVIAPYIVNGRPLKSVNQYYNKEKAKKQSKLAKVNKGKKSSRKLRKLTSKRNNKIDDYMHKASRHIINHLISNGINTLVVGKNKGWKQEINIGDKSNQNFVGIPHDRFISMLRYKCKIEGINFIVKEESYTSKCSFIDSEAIRKHDVYMGKRIKRGLFKSANGTLINADVNGGLNILRKAVPTAVFNGIEVIAVSPRVISL